MVTSYERTYEAARMFTDLVDSIEDRCLAADGSVTLTLQEEELAELYRLARIIGKESPPVRELLTWHDRVVSEICNARLAAIIRDLDDLGRHPLLKGRNVQIGAVRGVVELLYSRIATLKEV